MIASFVTDWIWPGGSGGTIGDLVGGFEQLALAGIMMTIFWPRVRHAVERLFHRIFSSHPIHGEVAEVKRMLAHIITEHPDIGPLPPKPSSEVESAP